MATLGEELARLRTLKGWTLREVEERTKKRVSNSYLYQLENDAVKEPSPNVLYNLANVYGVSYGALMKLAGFVVPKSDRNSSGRQASVAFSALHLTEGEEKEILDYVKYLRRNKGKKR